MDLELILGIASDWGALKPNLSEKNPDGYDKAILGLTDDGQLVYSKEIMLELFMNENPDLLEEEAWDFLEFNTFGAYVGEQTPIYINTY